ncbi:MAG: hypothetical protein HKP02_13300 [Xanthomonadales bacterium]|nr:hypothetical protein [Xanthomonadales bacterium]
MVMKFDLPGLVGNADKVFRGTVVDKGPDTVTAGGGTLPVVVYTLQVDDAIKGDFGGEKESKTIQIRMLGNLKAQPQTGDIRRFAGIDMNLDLTVGGTYVLFTTQPSSIGLSTTVGLGQGLFRVFTDARGRELAANALDNQGLFDGAVSYADLKAAITAEMQ